MLGRARPIQCDSMHQVCHHLATNTIRYLGYLERIISLRHMWYFVQSIRINVLKCWLGRSSAGLGDGFRWIPVSLACDNIFGIVSLVHSFSRRLKSHSCMSTLLTTRKPFFGWGSALRLITLTGAVLVWQCRSNW